MSAGELDGDGPPRPFRGFSTYADDTPRDLDEPPYEDAFDEPVFDTFEPAHDSLILAPREDGDEPPAPSRGFGWTAGAALLVALAVGAGFVLTRGGWAPKTPAPPPAGTKIEMAAAPEMSTPTLAPSKPVQQDRARSAPRAPPPVVHLAQAAEPPPRFVDREVSSNASASLPAPAPVAPPVAQPAPAPTRPSFDCQGAQTRAQQMICSDPRLAAADRRLNQAYAAALAASGSEDELRSEQADWLEIREDAARYSNRAVLNIYEQRTRELEALAEDGPPPPAAPPE